MKRSIPYLLAFIMLAGAAGHIFIPSFYFAMIPSFISADLANILAAIVEGIIGVALLIPAWRRAGGLAFSILMVLFLPLHIWDLIREDPVTGSLTGAMIRLAIQFVLIYLGWRVWKSVD